MRTTLPSSPFRLPLRPGRPARRGAPLSFLALALLVSVAAAQETRTIEPDDYYRVQRVGSSEISPDGRYLLYTVETVRRAQNDRLTHIWYTDLETGRSQRLSTAGVNSTNPGWTPDGRRVYFTTSRGGESGIHFLNFLEPGGEAYRIPGIPASPIFSPDGSWVLVSRQVAESQGDDPAPGGAAPAAPGGGRGQGAGGGRGAGSGACWPSGTPGLNGPGATRGQTETQRNCDVYVITHTAYKRDGTLAFVGPPSQGQQTAAPSGDQPRRYTQFFRIPADGLASGEEAEQLTFDPVNKSFASFSPDGSWILYTVNLTQQRAAEARDQPDEEPQQQQQQEEEESASGSEMPEIGIYRVPANGGGAEEIVTVRGQVSSVRQSPNGQRVAFALTEARRTDGFVRVVDVRNGQTVADIGRDWKHSIGALRWTPDSREIHWVSATGGQDQIVKAPAAGGPITYVTEGQHTLGSVSYDARMSRMAYVKNSADRPWEVFVAAPDGGGERQVSHVNQDWLEQVRLGRVERFTFEGVPHNREWLDELKERGVEHMLANNAPDGERPEIESWLVYPPDYEPGRRYPMVVYIHGGPHSRYADTWFHEFQMVAAQGIVVLYTNPRGSSGYGQDFQFMTLNAWGIDDTKDVLQAVDLVVERGLADPDRLGISGGSYGGFMTNWITAHDQRWRTAITDRSISNWISFYGVSDASGLVENEFGGMPWPFMSMEEGSYLLATMLSPIVWADRVTTPTLIIHSLNDYRTPLEGGEQWYRALKKHDIPVKMVLFPDTSHGLSRTGEPWLLVRRLREYVDWFRAYLVDDQPVVAVDADGS